MAKKIELTIEVPAPVSDVWKAWTTTDGVKLFFAPDASVNLTVGGEFEVHFDKTAPEGKRGSEGCKILAFDPERLLLFTWNAPPQYPAVRDGNKKTWVIIEFSDLGTNRTQISLTHLGWRNGEEWDKVYDYFVVAWPKVLSWLKNRFTNGPRKFD